MLWAHYHSGSSCPARERRRSAKLLTTTDRGSAHHRLRYGYETKRIRQNFGQLLKTKNYPGG